MENNKLNDEQMEHAIKALANHLLYRYNHLCAEIRHQKHLFPSENEYNKAIVKYMGIVNYLQGVQLKHL